MNPFSQRSWESAVPTWERNSAHDGESSDEELYDCVGDRAGDELLNYLLSLVWQGNLSAKHACSLAWYAEKAGATGAISNIALKPNSQTGKFQRKIDKYCGVDLKEHKHYLAAMPAHSKYDNARYIHSLPMRLPHEVLETEFRDDPNLIASVVAARSAGKLPSAYEEHVVVRSNVLDVILPLVIYFDGVLFNKRSSLFAVTLYVVTTGRRHLLALLRKEELCHCGCAGWCSLWVLFETLRWSLQHCAEKRWPLQRDDSRPWHAVHDSERAQRAGNLLSVRACLLFIKADWAEFAHTVGLANWASRLSPCPFCFAPKIGLYEVDGLSLASSPYPETGPVDYERACSDCERVVSLSAADHAVLKIILVFDRRKTGSRGRALTKDYPPLRLHEGDRLECSTYLRDVAAFEAMHEFPATVVFWRPDCETRTRHRFPLFDVRIGVTQMCLQIDVLHSLWLGPAQDWVGTAFWAVLLADVFGFGDTRAESERIELALFRIRSELFDWYKVRCAEGAPSDFTRLEDLQLSMLGTKNSQKFSSKAAECKTILPFVIDLVRRHALKIGEKSSHLIGAGEALLEFGRCVRVRTEDMTVGVCQAFTCGTGGKRIHPYTKNVLCLRRLQTIQTVPGFCNSWRTAIETK